jgi:hypothetical protein
MTMSPFPSHQYFKPGAHRIHKVYYVVGFVRDDTSTRYSTDYSVRVAPNDMQLSSLWFTILWILKFV